MVVDPEGYAKIVRHLVSQTFVGESDPRLLLRETVREVRLCAANGNAECPSHSNSGPNPNPIASSSHADENERCICVRTAEGHEYRSHYCIVTFSVLEPNLLLVLRVRVRGYMWSTRSIEYCTF